MQLGDYWKPVKVLRQNLRSLLQRILTA